MNERWLNWSYYEVPDHTQKAFEEYILLGYPPGSFMGAVLRNDFVAAVCHADVENKQHLVDIAKWMLNNAPRACWGSEQAVRDWLKDKDNVRTSYFEFVEKRRMWEALQEH